MGKDGLLPMEQVEKPLDEVDEEELTWIIHAGEATGLRMYHFKEKELLPRVNAVMGLEKY